MTDKQLLKLASSFRAGILDGRISDSMCFIIEGDCIFEVDREGNRKLVYDDLNKRAAEFICEWMGTAYRAEAEVEKLRAENAQLRANQKQIQARADLMLNAAQTLRIQQSQATAEWESSYKEKADEAWANLNRAHKQITDICSDASEGEKQ